jgi:hypothetical protein
MPAGPEPAPAAMSVRMSDGSVDGALVRDVQGAEPGVAWRWTNQHPRIRLWVDRPDGLDLVLKFTLPGVVLKQTGAIHAGITVNEQRIDTITLDREQEYQYVKRVPPGVVAANAEAVVGLDFDRTFVSPRDGVRLAVLLEEAGFQRAEGK